MKKGKIIASVISIITIIIFILGVFTQVYLQENDYYSYLLKDKVNSVVEEHIRKDAYDLMNYVVENDFDNIDYKPLRGNKTNLKFMLKDSTGEYIASNVTLKIRENEEVWRVTISYSVKDFGFGPHIETQMNQEIVKDNYYVFYAYIDENLSVADTYKEIYDTHNYGYYLNIVVNGIVICSLVAGIISFAYISNLYAKNQVKNNLKFFLIILLVAAFVYKNIYFIYGKWMISNHDLYMFVIYPLLAMYLSLVIIGILKLFYSPMVIEKLKNIVIKLMEKAKDVFRKLAFVKRASIIILGITFLEFVLIRLCWNNMILYLALWVLEKIIILPFIFIVLFDLKKIKIAGEEYASGNLEYQLQTDNMNWDFKEHGENMNRIADGLNIAIEKRIQSERMKTELITNVSHDIKTPITSIINYAGLIEKELCNSEKHKEYAEVLVRKASHLKRLLDDLVEASKATTGSIEMHMEECDATILLNQVVGEFEDKIQESKLELISKIPDEPIKILADSRRIWRVFENLMMNACKYSLEGSRVYLSLENIDGKAIFSFRNTSKHMLNITVDELMERFVRGDSARSTEGNGLGLSIAKSLTELQNGNMDIIIDGDLFKVILQFPVIS